MRIKLFIATILLVTATGKLFAQTDTLNLYLERDSIRQSGVNLVFENNSCDTILLFTRFPNFNLTDEIHRNYIGIYTKFYNNDRFVVLRYDKLPEIYDFSPGFTLIDPYSQIKLFFEIGEYWAFSYNNNLEVSLLVNYYFAKHRHSEALKKVVYFETNRVLMGKPREPVEVPAGEAEQVPGTGVPTVRKPLPVRPNSPPAAPRRSCCAPGDGQ